MNDNPGYYGMISISKKAGKLLTGEARCEEAIRGGKAYIVILSEDASDNTKKKFSDMAAYRNLPIVWITDRTVFGKLIGKKFAVSGVVTDRGLADSILKKY